MDYLRSLFFIWGSVRYLHWFTFDRGWLNKLLWFWIHIIITWNSTKSYFSLYSYILTFYAFGLVIAVYKINMLNIHIMMVQYKVKQYAALCIIIISTWYICTRNVSKYDTGRFFYKLFLSNSISLPIVCRCIFSLLYITKWIGGLSRYVTVDAMYCIYNQ